MTFQPSRDATFLCPRAVQVGHLAAVEWVILESLALSAPVQKQAAGFVNEPPRA